MMRRRHFSTALMAGLASTANLPALARNGDGGEYVILHARYGTDRRQVDVTGRLRELARQDRRLQLTNDLFGVDPDPGRTKTLSIVARDPAGQERQFDFRERDWIDGAQFAGWGRGDWGDLEGPRGGHDDGEYTIQYATYGASGRDVDVTDRLRELARRDQQLRLTNDLFGVDPYPGQTKILRIYARDRAGQEHVFDYREYGTIDGQQFIGWSRGDWGRGARGRRRRDDAGPLRGGRLVIENASYGADNRWADVTQALRAQLHGDRFEAEVGNGLFGIDPAPGRRKQLSVTYRFGNEAPRTVSVNERDWLRLP